MKLPGQRRGEVVDRIVETVDIFPTILDVVGAKASLRLDGRSLIDGPSSGALVPHLHFAQPVQRKTRGPSEICRQIVPQASTGRSAGLDAET